MAAHKGKQHHNAKLRPEDVREIRRRLAKGESYRAVSFSFPVQHSSIYRIAKGRTWRHVK